VYDRSCTGCHTLSGRERGAQGGDLALTGLDAADLASFARTMPVRPPLDAADANAVAEYVHAVAARFSSSAHGGGLEWPQWKSSGGAGSGPRGRAEPTATNG
jgi:hypothetical protein